jgi:SAM-dependent methyltransferase
MRKRVANAVRWRLAAGSERLKALLGTRPVHWARVVMDRETARYVAELGPGTRRVLEVSGEKWKDFGFASYRSAGLPEFDVCDGPLPERFDVVIAEQVLEHVLWPYRAVRSMREMLNPGGTLVLTTPFLLRVHECPVDCSRWTETGLKYLLAEAGFGLDEVVTGSWGNRGCARANMADWFPRWNPYIHSLRNDPRYPVCVWCFARQP